jgi:crotonobetainyl-CoA:carnitine CoA-transferase CaiB-like acyl-CoA transferase
MQVSDRPTPLHDLRVVEISDRIAGSYCGKLLLDAGAEVHKVHGDLFASDRGRAVL